MRIFSPQKPELDATQVPTLMDIAWASGIYEGEGTCQKKSVGRGVQVFVVQKDPELLYRLRGLFGGRVRACNYVGTPEEVNHWVVSGDRARIFLALIYPQMTARRKAQIDATPALDFFGEKRPQNSDLLEVQQKLIRFYEGVRQQQKESRKKFDLNYTRRYRARKREEAKQIQESAKVVAIA